MYCFVCAGVCCKSVSVCACGCSRSITRLARARARAHARTNGFSGLLCAAKHSLHSSSSSSSSRRPNEAQNHCTNKRRQSRKVWARDVISCCSLQRRHNWLSFECESCWMTRAGGAPLQFAHPPARPLRRVITTTVGERHSNTRT